MRTGEEDEGSTAQPLRRRTVVPRSVKPVLGLLALALIVQYLVLPQLSLAWSEVDVVRRVDPLLLLAGAVLQVAAYLTHAQLTRSVLPGEHQPSLLTMSAIEVASRAISHVVPGGTAAGAALNFQLLRQRNVRAADAAFAAATQGIGAAVVLNILLFAALVVSIPLRGYNPYYGTAALLGALLIAGFAVLVLLLVKAEDRTSELVGRILEKLPFVQRESAERVVRRIAERVNDLRSDPPLLRRAIFWAVVHWLFDAASLWVFLAAFGPLVPADILFVAFGIANVLAAIPVSPRGLGVVEATLLAALLWFGVPSTSATLGIAAYRLVNFWLPIPIGALAYLSLRLAPTEPEDVGPREVLRRWVADALAQAESAKEWAARHGLGASRRGD